MYLINIVITCFIKCELDEFELNWMNVWYDVVSMFVNDDTKWWSRHSIFKKWDTRIEIVYDVRCLWVWSIRRYSDYTGILESYRSRYLGSLSRRRFIWLHHGVKNNRLNYIIWINLVTWVWCMRWIMKAWYVVDWLW